MVAAPVSRSLWRDALKRLFKNRAAVVGGITLVFFTIVAIFAPVIAPQHYADGNLFANYAPPSREYPLGADFLGRDLLSRIIYGTRISLAVGFLGAFFAFSIGLAYGTVSGYFSGRLDNVLMRIVDILYAFPSLLFIILLM
ncbi:MAG: ABC transporter permease, partial [Trueperaceae bacterium]